MYFHQASARALSSQGVQHLFGLLGDGNLHFVRSFVDDCGGVFHPSSYEGNAVMAAHSFGQLTGGVGVATVTHGPALTNTITALVEGVKGRRATVLIAADTPPDARQHPQDIDQRAIARAADVGWEQVTDAAGVPQDLARAMRRAETERRPVVLNVPSQLTWLEADYRWSDVNGGRVPVVEPATRDVEAAIEVLAASDRPLVLVGRGAASDAAKEAAIRLAGLLGAPLATTLLAKDLFEGHRFNLGVHGTLSHQVAMTWFSRVDCIVALGASLNEWTTDKGSLLEGKDVIHVDLDADAIGRWHTPRVGIVADAAATADAMSELYAETELGPRPFASPELRDAVARAEPPHSGLRVTPPNLDLHEVCDVLNAGLPEDRTVVADSGRFMLVSLSTIKVTRPPNFVMTTNFGSIGLGMGAAIGAAVAAPDRTTVLLTGDGGFALSGLAELSHCVQQGLNLIVVIFNDGAYGAEHVQLRALGLDPSLSLLAPVEFAQVASSMHARGFTVEQLSQLEDALDSARRHSGVSVIDIRLDPDYIDSVGH